MTRNNQPAEKRVHLEDGSLEVIKYWRTIQGEGSFVGKPSVFVRLAGCNLECPHCFHANTVIRMGDLSKKLISEIRKGDVVLSYDEDSQKFKKRRVLRTFSRETDEIYRVIAGAKKTYVTGEHPFLVKGKGWIEAGDLVPGDVILHLSISERMKMKNPMKNPVIAAKCHDTLRMNGGHVSPWDRMSEKERRKLSRRTSKRMKSNNPMKDPEVAIKGFLNRKDLGKKSSAEIFVEEVGKDLGLVFVGDGSLVVANKCPDFLIEGTNKLIEVWDRQQTEFYGRDFEWRKSRRSEFESEGYEVLFLPVTPFSMGDEVGKREKIKAKHRDKEVARVRKKIGEFSRNGRVVRSVERITRSSNPKAWTRLTGRYESSLLVYDLEVEKNHNYVADGMIVHNCDTQYTKGRTRFSYRDLAIKVMAISLADSPLVVLTGGEPLRQNIGPFVSYLVVQGMTVQIETNGTYGLRTVGRLRDVHVVCSPKTPKVADGLQVDAYKYVLDHRYVSLDDGLPTRVLGLKKPPARPPVNFNRNQIYVQPMDENNQQSNTKNLEAAMGSCFKYGYRLSLQLHKYLGLE